MKALIGYLLAFIVLTTVTLDVSAKNKSIYVWKNEDGVLVFSDTPRKGAEKVKLNSPAMSMPSTDTSILNETTSTKATLNFAIKVTSPAAEETIRDNTGSVHVTGQISPRFLKGHTVQLYLDGAPYGEPQGATVFVMRNVNRGEHQVALELIDAQGNTLATSPPTTFFLHRATVN